jgi:hypothetical protein
VSVKLVSNVHISRRNPKELALSNNGDRYRRSRQELTEQQWYLERHEKGVGIMVLNKSYFILVDEFFWICKERKTTIDLPHLLTTCSWNSLQCNTVALDLHKASHKKLFVLKLDSTINSLLHGCGLYLVCNQCRSKSASISVQYDLR